MIGIVAAMGGEIEGDRQALLPGGEVAAIEGVGVLRRGEAGILPDGPGLVDIHGRVGAAQIGRDARPGLEEIEAFEIGLAIGRLDRNALGRQPRLGLAGGRCGRDRLKGDIGEIRNAAHALLSLLPQTCGSARSTVADFSCRRDRQIPCSSWRPQTTRQTVIPVQQCKTATISNDEFDRRENNRYERSRSKTRLQSITPGTSGKSVETP